MQHWDAIIACCTVDSIQLVLFEEKVFFTVPLAIFPSLTNHKEKKEHMQMEVSHPKQRGHDGKPNLKYQATNKRLGGKKEL